MKQDNLKWFLVFVIIFIFLEVQLVFLFFNKQEKSLLKLDNPIYPEIEENISIISNKNISQNDSVVCKKGFEFVGNRCQEENKNTSMLLLGQL